MFDQRNCGRSLPHAGDPAVSLEANTTWHLVADMERLRNHLSIDRWLVFGGSWGSALSLAYAQTHPERVTELVLRGIFTARPFEQRWSYTTGEGASLVYPDLWEKFVAPISEVEHGDLIAAYSRRLHDADPEIHLPAARAWTDWENATTTLLPPAEDAGKTDDAHTVALARIENHYFINGGFFEEDRLINNVDKIRHIPCVIVQGRYDMCTPTKTAWDLHRAWPEAELHIIPDAGHTSSELGILDKLIETTDRFVSPTGPEQT